MKPISMREADFKREVWSFSYPDSVKTEFFDYWTEPNKSGSKMKFEMEKTWHTGRRIARWANNGFSKIESRPIAKPQIKKEIVTDLDKVDAMMQQYALRPTQIPFSEFGQWYELLKTERLLKPFSKPEIEEIKEVYQGDNQKCRSACVQKTFDHLINYGLTFSKLKERV